jgi:hypothetical protein
MPPLSILDLAFVPEGGTPARSGKLAAIGVPHRTVEKGFGFISYPADTKCGE